MNIVRIHPSEYSVNTQRISSYRRIYEDICNPRISIFSYFIDNISIFFEYEWINSNYRALICIISYFLNITSIIVSLIYTSYLKDGGLIFLCCFSEIVFIISTIFSLFIKNIVTGQGVPVSRYGDPVLHKSIKISVSLVGIITKLMVLKSISYIIIICSFTTLLFYYTYYKLRNLINRDSQVQPVMSDEVVNNIINNIINRLNHSQRNLQVLESRLQIEAATGPEETLQNNFPVLEHRVLVNEYYEKIKILKKLETNKILYECLTHTGTDETCQECLCCVCMESKDKKEVYKYDCNHTIHKECTIEFITRNNLININCALCRQKI